MLTSLAKLAHKYSHLMMVLGLRWKLGVGNKMALEDTSKECGTVNSQLRERDGWSFRTEINFSMLVQKKQFKCGDVQ